MFGQNFSRAHSNPFFNQQQAFSNPLTETNKTRLLQANNSVINNPQTNPSYHNQTGIPSVQIFRPNESTLNLELKFPKNPPAPSTLPRSQKLDLTTNSTAKENTYNHPLFAQRRTQNDITSNFQSQRPSSNDSPFEPSYQRNETSQATNLNWNFPSFFSNPPVINNTGFFGSSSNVYSNYNGTQLQQAGENSKLHFGNSQAASSQNANTKANYFGDSFTRPGTFTGNANTTTGILNNPIQNFNVQPNNNASIFPNIYSSSPFATDFKSVNQGAPTTNLNNFTSCNNSSSGFSLFCQPATQPTLNQQSFINQKLSIDKNTNPHLPFTRSVNPLENSSKPKEPIKNLFQYSFDSKAQHNIIPTQIQRTFGPLDNDTASVQSQIPHDSAFDFREYLKDSTQAVKAMTDLLNNFQKVNLEQSRNSMCCCSNTNRQIDMNKNKISDKIDAQKIRIPYIPVDLNEINCKDVKNSINQSNSDIIVEDMNDSNNSFIRVNNISNEKEFAVKQDILDKSLVESINFKKESSENDSITNSTSMFQLNIAIEKPFKTSFSVFVKENSKISSLKSRIISILQESIPFFKKISKNSFFLIKNFSLLEDNMFLNENEEEGIIYVIFKNNFSNVNATKANAIQASKKKKNKSKQSEKQSLAPKDKLPILNTLSNNSYKTTPDFISICRMSEEELKNINNFSIYNQFGRIDFEGVTDLSNLNLDRIVTIKEKLINLYQNNSDLNPTVGEGLNKPAVVHMYKCFPNSEEDLSLYIASLIKTCEDKGAEFKNYDKITGEWTFGLNHFV